jgi:restriction system protein
MNPYFLEGRAAGSLAPLAALNRKDLCYSVAPAQWCGSRSKALPMAIPDYQSLMLPLLKHAACGETHVPDVASKLADEFGLTEEERNQLLPTKRQQVLNNRIHWAKFYMVKAGLIDQPQRGCFVASERGRELLAQNPPTISVETLLEYPTFREFYRGSNAQEEPTAPPSSAAATDKTPEEQIEAAHIALQLALREELIQRIMQNSSSFFEQVIVEEAAEAECAVAA